MYSALASERYIEDAVRKDRRKKVSYGFLRHAGDQIKGGQNN